MIPAIAFLCLAAGTIAIPVPTDYYPKSQGYGGLGINGGLIGVNNNGFESSILGFNGGNSAAAAAAAASAASGLNSAAAAAAAAADGSRHLVHQGGLGINNGLNAEFGINGGNSAASTAAAASGLNAAAAAAAAAASTAQRSLFTGIQGHSGHQLVGSSYGPFVQQVSSVQFPGVQQFNGIGGSAAAAAAAAAAGQQSAAAAAAAAAGRNAAAAAAAAAGRNAAAAAAAAAAGRNAAAAAAAASASGSNFGPQIGIGGSHLTSQIGGQFAQPAAYYPDVPFVGQTSEAAAAASVAASNNAAAATAAAASASGSNRLNGGIIGGSSGVIGSQFVRGKKY